MCTSLLHHLADMTLCLFTAASEPRIVIRGNDDVLRDRLFSSPDVSRHHQLLQQQQQQHPVVYGRRQGNGQQQQQRQRPDAVDARQVMAGGGIESLSDVLLTRIFYSGLRSDDLCRCAAVCRRWNRLVWNPLLWTCIDLSQAPDCDADAALRSDYLKGFCRTTHFSSFPCCSLKSVTPFKACRNRVQLFAERKNVIAPDSE